jgi:hypothetical protein
LPHVYSRLIQKWTHDDLKGLLTTCRALKAARKEDKIFSLYYLFRKIDPSFPAPDYSKPLADIYREAMVLVLQHDNALMLLDSCFDLDDSFPRCSWVPDWSCNIGCPFVQASASQQSEPRFNLSPDHKQLSLFGIVADRVRVRTSPLPRFAQGLNDYDEPIDDRISIRVKFIQTWRKWVECLRTLRPYDSTERAVRALWSLLMDFGGRNQSSSWPDNDCAQLFFALLQEPDAQQKEFIEESLRFLASARYAAEYAPHFDIPELVTYTILQFSNLSPVLESMKSLAPASYAFLVTTSGYLGFAPPLTAPDDLLVLFSGIQYPMVIRRLDENHYCLIGPAWIQGMMDGELWEGDNELTKFIIC